MEISNIPQFSPSLSWDRLQSLTKQDNWNGRLERWINQASEHEIQDSTCRKFAFQFFFLALNVCVQVWKTISFVSLLSFCGQDKKKRHLRWIFCWLTKHLFEQQSKYKYFFWEIFPIVNQWHNIFYLLSMANIFNWNMALPLYDCTDKLRNGINLFLRLHSEGSNGQRQ